MRTYTFEGASRVRLWVDESLPANYAGHDLRRRVDITGRCERITRAVAVEARVAAGAVVRYGLLGAQFVPTDGAVLEVGIRVASERIAFETPLAITPERVQLGLTQTYAEAIADVLVIHASSLLGSGSLQVRWAAHGQIGSSSTFFAEIAQTVVSLLGSKDTSEEAVATCISERLGLRRI